MNRAIRWARWVRGALLLCATMALVQAGAGVVLWRLGDPGKDIFGFVGLSYLASLLCALAGLAWAHACYQTLEKTFRGPPPPPLFFWWAMLFYACVPCVGVCAVLVLLLDLNRRAAPDLLPPLYEEQARSGGFRDNAVVMRRTGATSRPWVWVWFVAWVASYLLPFAHPTIARNDPLAVSLAGALSLLAALLAARMVGAITRNLAELHRRATLPRS